MHGFIAESTSKISDGLWSTGKLILLSLFLTLFPDFLKFQGISQARLIYLVLLMAGGVFFLYQSLADRFPDTQHAMNGMVAGLIFWQAVRFSGLPDNWILFQSAGYLLWLGSALVIYLLWTRRVLPVGMRFMLLVIMVHWIGRLLLMSLSSSISIGTPGLIGLASARLVGIVGSLSCLWYIMVRSANPLQRRYAAVGLYSSILLSFLLF